VQAAVVAVHTVEYRWRERAAMAHQAVAVCRVERLASCGAQRDGEAAEGDHVRIVHVHQAGDAPTQRRGHEVQRTPCTALPAGPFQHGVRVTTRVGRRRLTEMPGEGPPVDLQVPAAASPAAAAQVVTAERHVPVLTGCPVGARHGPAADHQRAADPDLDDQMQGGSGVGCRPGAGLGDAGEGGVVADEQG